jgi:hypothetical protein
MDGDIFKSKNNTNRKKQLSILSIPNKLNSSIKNLLGTKKEPITETVLLQF